MYEAASFGLRDRPHLLTARLAPLISSGAGHDSCVAVVRLLTIYIYIASVRRGPLFVFFFVSSNVLFYSVLP